MWLEATLPGFEDFLKDASIVVRASKVGSSILLTFDIKPSTAKTNSNGICLVTIGPIRLES